MSLSSPLKATVFALIAICLTIFSVTALANVVILTNGSILIGDSIAKQEEKLVMSTSFAGEIKINWGDIAEIKSHETIPVQTADGELIETLLITDQDNPQTDGPLITLIDDSNTELDSIQIVSDNTSEVSLEPWEQGIGAKFEGLVDFGLQFDRGNTEAESLATNADLKWRRVDDRWGVAGKYFKEETSDVITEDNWLIRSNYDYFLTESWYVGLFGQLEQDRIANLDQRLTVGPLIGHQFWESDETNLSSEVGLVYVDEKFDYDTSDMMEDFADNSSYTGFRWNIKYDKYTFKDIVQLYYENELLLDASDLSNNARTVFKAVAGARVFLVENLSAGAEFQYDYDGSATGSTKKEDTKTVIKLGYSW
jgi:putative salt-induced outer membrane protein YdiY